MIFGKVFNKDKIYISPIFGINCGLTNSEVIIFDENYTELIVADLYKDYKNIIFYLKYDYGDFAIQKEKFKSYWNDKDIFKRIRKKDYSFKIIEEAKKFLNDYDINEYYAIASEKDLEGLDINVGGFHDAYVLAMKQNAENVEILIDTTWGSLISLRCYGVLKNELKIGDSFSCCTMNIDNDNNIEFSYDSFDSRELLLKSEKIEYKPFFVISCKTNSFNYKFANDGLIIVNGKKEYKINHENIVDDVLDLKERNVIGYFYNDDEILRCIMLFKDFAVSYYEYFNFKKLKNNIYNRFNKFKIECKEHNLNFDDYPWIDYEGPSVEDLGEVLYRKDYNKVHMLWNTLKYALIGPLILNLIILLIQILNPEMKWTFYLIFGLGNTGLVIFIILIICAKDFFSKDSPFSTYLEIRKKGITYISKFPSFCLTYDVITQIEFDKKIIIICEYSKYALPKSKDDVEIYKVLKEHLEKYRLASESAEE